MTTIEIDRARETLTKPMQMPLAPTTTTTKVTGHVVAKIEPTPRLRALVIADIHLGAGSEFGPDRLNDQAEVLKLAARRAIDEGCDAVLLAGDAFHRRKPSPAENMVFREFLRMLDEAGLMVYSVAGNHDVSTMEAPDALTVHDGGVLVHARRPVVKTYGGVQIAMLPWCPPSRALADWTADEIVGIDAALASVGESLNDVAWGLRAMCDKDKPAILMLHWSVSGAETPTGAFTDDFREPVIDKAALAAQGWDAVVCGHIHMAQDLMDPAHEPHGPIFYPGSPAVVDWGEVHKWHGGVILTVVGDKIEKQNVSFDDRRFFPVDVDATVEDDDPAGLVYARVARAPEGSVVRVRFTVTEEQYADVDQRQIADIVEQKGAYLYAVQPTIIRSVRAGVALDESVGPLEAIGEWCKAQGLEADETARVTRRASELLQVVESR